MGYFCCQYLTVPSCLTNSVFTPLRYPPSRRRFPLCSPYTCHIQTFCTGNILHLLCFRYTLQLGTAVSSFLLLRLPQVLRCHLLTERVKAWMLRIFLVSSATRKIIKFVLRIFLPSCSQFVCDLSAWYSKDMWSETHKLATDVIFTKHYIDAWSKMPFL
jgi:hypothetical protein